MNAKETIESYLSEMLSWEESFYKVQRSQEFRSGTSDYRQQQQSSARVTLNDILSKYLTISAYDTIGHATLITMSVGNPSIHKQIVVECVEKVKTATVISDAPNYTVMPLIFKFTLTLEDADWKINALHRASPVDRNWKKSSTL
jgi:hypothetical protein